MHDGNIFLYIFLAVIFVGAMRGRRSRRSIFGLREEVQELRDRLSNQQQAPAALPGPSREEVRKLEERVRVLERIVTDRNYTLADEIDALRDKPARSLEHEGDDR